MAHEILLVAVGLALLAGGGEVLVRGAVGLALRLRVTPAVIGLTVVSAGTSMPELVVSTVASVRGRADVAVGNVIGSNIFNVGLVLGVCALLVSLPVAWNTIRIEWPFLVAASLAAIAFMAGGLISRAEGAVLVFALAGFTWFMVRLARRDVERAEARADALGRGAARAPHPGIWSRSALVLAGLAALFFGGELIVDGATGLALGLGISDRVVGLTVVAMGTSLPELASSLIAALRGQTEVAVGNVIGSCVFNLLGIFGVAALAHPLPVDPRFLAGDVWWMLAFAVVVGPLVFRDRRVGRWDGVVLLALFAGYMVTVFRGAGG